jgi:hypothetical protein
MKVELTRTETRRRALMGFMVEMLVTQDQDTAIRKQAPQGRGGNIVDLCQINARYFRTNDWRNILHRKGHCSLHLCFWERLRIFYHLTSGFILRNKLTLGELEKQP